MKLTEGKYLKRAALLLFHPDPLAFVTGAFVKVGYFRTAADLVYHDEINGDLFSQVQQTQELLLTKYMKAAIAYEGLVRVERFPVPRAALREAVLNALVHRDYMVPAPTQIRLYDDRLVLWNPATLPDGWTQETLLGPHQSQPPNPDIANAFFRAGEIEAWGRGIERIFAACREAATPVPQIRLEAGGLWMEFPFADDYLRAVSPAAGLQPITEPGGKSSGKSSGKTEARILAMVKKEPGLSIPQMAAALDITTRAVEKQIRQLKAIGRLRRVGPAKGGHWDVMP